MGCQPPKDEEPEAKTKPGLPKIVVVSPDFPAEGEIPAGFSAYGKNVSPSLNWTDVPEKAKSLALIVEDPDAPGAKPFVHWLVANLPVKPNLLAQNQPQTDTLKERSGIQGRNGMKSLGYFGPKPPSGTHHYHFKIYALDSTLDLPKGFDREQLEAAMKGHKVAEGEIVGTFTAK